MSRHPPPSFGATVVPMVVDVNSGGTKLALAWHCFHNSERNHFHLVGRWTLGVGLRGPQLESSRNRTPEKKTEKQARFRARA